LISFFGEKSGFLQLRSAWGVSKTSFCRRQMAMKIEGNCLGIRALVLADVHPWR
jgi:hypothetical protein